MDARPCFYCIVLLSTLFVSSCYWQPFPIDNELVIPWSENVTTFAQALNATLPHLELPKPPVIRVVDRCWCDFSSGNFFEPYNVSQWEHTSVQRLKTELELQQKIEEARRMEPQNVEDESNGKDATSIPGDTTTMMPRTPTPRGTSKGFLEVLRSIYRDTRSVSSILPSTPTPSAPIPSESSTPPASSSEPQEPLPFLRKEYDLRPYGMDMLIDFGWSRP